MREAQGWSGRTSPRIGPLSRVPHTSFSPVFLHTGSLPMRRRRPGVSSALLHASPRAAGGSTAMGRSTNAVRYHGDASE
jgi:hypothetical protein